MLGTAGYASYDIRHKFAASGYITIGGIVATLALEVVWVLKPN
jgi:hypothetical protein